MTTLTLLPCDAATVWCDVAAIEALHLAALSMPGWPAAPTLSVRHPLLTHVVENHRCNALLWEQEDQARRTDVPDSAIVANKRAIDRYNQQRNDAIEAMDAAILEALAAERIAPASDAWVNSETAGSLIDRMSIGTLKVHHMALQAERRDADDAHRQRCAAGLASLREQRDHLGRCLRQLWSGMLAGRCTYRAHRQFKMYNDPALNPSLYGAAVPPDTAACAREA
ncbi:DUF4254 domain-containing protein [Cupriavidus gilardii]|uniref:DUF4254 domain-containing protein n=1 Tax=Cupriavidus gilardii TaxID=82541 RepID=UPI001EE56B06|nr:DUF4254 domain-containing protein [Cupriavidus gilardii]MCG5258967.1 DUF4254 domain-containing protein [Cupriavidus gilardii]